MKFRTIIVEDELLSRTAISQMIAKIPWLHNVAEASTVKQAITAINQHTPDVLFLDIEMPGGSGLDVLKKSTHVPNIIFTTAHAQYAVKAFDKNAVDYLLKPFSSRRFEVAIEKLRARLFDSLADVKIFIRSGQQMLPLILQQVDYFVADHDYVVAHSGDEERLLSTTLSALEEQLPAEQYVRVHRSYIVNSRLICNMQKVGDRQLKINMRNGAQIVSSRAGTRRLQALIR